LELPNPPLMLIADIGLAGDRIRSILEASLDAGCRWIMVRGKTAPASVFEETVATALKLSSKYGAYVYVNGHPELVPKMGAHGLHLPWGWSIPRSRQAVGTGIPIGVSTHSLEEAVKAYMEGADYITLSPIYDSISKQGYRPALGLHELKRVAETVKIPVIALGGIRPGRAQPCLSHGARGVAVMGGVILSTDPYHVMKMLVEETSIPRP
jgi:thiamine-phosphate pyrophosphorylase